MNFYPRLALTNIKNNKQIYIPYILTSIFTTAMYYIVSSLGNNQALENHRTTGVFMSMGQYVIIVFAAIFLFYANSFIIKRRKKEMSLYNILGMEKRHLMIMMFFETCLTTIISIGLGLIVGILFSQLMYLILINMIHVTNEFVFSIPLESVLMTIVIFVCIFFLSLLFNIIQVKISNPMELMRGSQTGEKEPKTKIFMTLIGIITLSIGYYIALSIDEPMSAIALFFVAVILVIIGTYSLFTAGSIALLKALKKNKGYYYQTKHFTSVSGMIYRMKQNAVGLANICILCTCVLVTLSSTICMYSGIGETVESLCATDQFLSTEDQDGSRLYGIARRHIIATQIKVRDYYELETYEAIASFKDGHQISLTDDYKDFKKLTNLNFVTQDAFNQAFDQKVNLKENEIILYHSQDFKGKTLKIGDDEFQVKGIFEDRRIMTYNAYGSIQIAIVVKDKNVIDKIAEKYRGGSFQKYLNVGFNSDDERATKVGQDILAEYSQVDHGSSYRSLFKKVEMDILYETYGGLLFIGIFLSVMFMIGAILIIYYKQLTEGFEDQKRFEILQNVGMSHKEVKQTIRSQVLVFFFLPLVVAVIHLCVAYSLILNVLQGFLLGSPRTYILSCCGCILGLVIIYSIVYSLTAKTYYQIVKK